MLIRVNADGLSREYQVAAGGSVRLEVDSTDGPVSVTLTPVNDNRVLEVSYQSPQPVKKGKR